MSTPSTLFHLTTSAYLLLQSLPLLLTPSLITTTLLSPSATGTTPGSNGNPYYDGPAPHRTTPVETYLARALAFALLAYAALLLLLSGVLPVGAGGYAGGDGDGSGDGEARGKNPYFYPATVVTTAYHAVGAFYLYMQVASFWASVGMGAGMVGSGALFCWGMWVVLFDGDKGHIGKRSGTDKRTSGWPFVNSQSSREIKKRRQAEAEAEVRRRSGRLN